MSNYSGNRKSPTRLPQAFLRPDGNTEKLFYISLTSQPEEIAEVTLGLSTSEA